MWNPSMQKGIQSKLGLPMVLLIASNINKVMACTYSNYYYNYRDICNGGYCNFDSQCESDYCLDYYCQNDLEPW